MTVAIVWHYGPMAAVIVCHCYDGWDAIATSVEVEGVAKEIEGLTSKRASEA